MGWQGETGPEGTRGIQGVQGVPGAQGDMGMMGPQGFTGETGDRGPEGPRGQNGIQGVQGVQGIQGERGQEGPVGPRGLSGVATAAASYSVTTQTEKYDAGNNIMFTTADDEGGEITYLQVAVFEMDLTMFNSIVHVSANTIGITQMVTYQDGFAVIRFFDFQGNAVDLDTLQDVTVIVF
jgi:hypothetical protein